MVWPRAGVTEQWDVVALLIIAPVLHVLHKEECIGTIGEEAWKLMG
ncbi:hypothetical protein PoMZ_12332 [Pyricularia oryzae]|uniref:Uncharacterized protein n=1 Tax=Pyricularia oryzae TaxID=318829 RepID=A0A4P7NSE6_PYROR|nr:hypothetical protein PoMZ_12332 [Pyricularia oryzae]